MGQELGRGQQRGRKWEASVILSTINKICKKIPWTLKTCCRGRSFSSLPTPSWAYLYLSKATGPRGTGTTGVTPSHRLWRLISLHISTDCCHHHPANSYSCELLGIRLLFSSSLISSPREWTADCHQAPKQVLVSPCACCCVWHWAMHTPGQVTQSGGLIGSKNTCVQAFCWSWIVWTAHTVICPTIPNTCIYTPLFCVMSKKQEKKILGQEPKRPVVPNDWFSFEGRFYFIFIFLSISFFINT